MQCFHSEIAQMGQTLLKFWAHSEMIGARSALSKRREERLSDIQLAAIHIAVSAQSFFASSQCKMHHSTYTRRLTFMNLMRYQESTEAACLQLP